MHKALAQNLGNRRHVGCRRANMTGVPGVLAGMELLGLDSSSNFRQRTSVYMQHCEVGKDFEICPGIYENRMYENQASRVNSFSFNLDWAYSFIGNA